MCVNCTCFSLVALDTFFDYTPVASTVTNLIDIFQKCLVVPFLEKSYVDSSRYYTHLKQKSFKRCILLLVPVIGNLTIIFSDVAAMKVKSNLPIPIQDGTGEDNSSDKKTN